VFLQTGFLESSQNIVGSNGFLYVKLGMRFDPNSDFVQNVFPQPTISSDSLISWNPFWTAELDCLSACAQPWRLPGIR